MRTLFALTILILLLTISFNSTCFAKTNSQSTLTEIEKTIIGMNFDTQTEQKRIERLEKAIYGEVSKGTTSQRLERIKKDISADVIKDQIEPKRDTFADEEDDEYYPQADKNVNYPIIDELEMQVFKKKFNNLRVNERLNKLETSTFKKIYDEDLNTRTERLKKVLLKEKNIIPQTEYELSDEDIYQDYNTFNIKPYSKFNQNENLSRNETPNFNRTNLDTDTLPLFSLEKSILRKTYPQDTTNTRLIRLESKLFNTTYTDDDTETRIERLAAAYSAKQNSQKYDSYKFQQRMATAMQIGAFILMILTAIL